MAAAGNDDLPRFYLLEKQSAVNEFFRHVRFTSQRMQGGLMTIQPGKEIGLERHDSDQFFAIVEGVGLARIDNVEFPIGAGSLFHVESQRLHNVTNTGDTPLRLVTVYAEPQHPIDEINETREDAERAEAPKRLVEGKYAIQPVDSENHIDAIELCVAPEQERYIGTVAEAIAIAHFNPVNRLLALYYEKKMIGFAMFSATAPVVHINRFLIDCKYQSYGHGRKCFTLLVRYLVALQEDATTIVIHVNPKNTIAKGIYEASGFVFDISEALLPNGEMEGVLTIVRKVNRNVFYFCVGCGCGASVGFFGLGTTKPRDRRGCGGSRITGSGGIETEEIRRSTGDSSTTHPNSNVYSSLSIG